MLILLMPLAACKKDIKPYQQESYVFGTHVELTIFAKNQNKARIAAAEIFADMDRLHTKLHTWHKDSELYKLNLALAAGKSATPDPELAGFIRTAQRFSKMSDGLFDPAVGQIVALWGFQADSYAKRLPDKNTFAKLIAAHPSMDDLHWHGTILSSSKREVAIDFGGMKGLALDRARDILLKANIHSALVNIGGNIIALGKHPDGSPWLVGIQNPRGASGKAMATIELANGEAIGTSGDYQRNFSVNGQEHCHLIDPRDGNSSCRKQAVTILMPASAEAGIRSDVLSKPLYFAELSDAGKYLQRFATPYALIVDNQGVIWVTPALAKRLVWLDNAPTHKILQLVKK